MRKELIKPTTWPAVIVSIMIFLALPALQQEIPQSLESKPVISITELEKAYDLIKKDETALAKLGVTFQGITLIRLDLEGDVFADYVGKNSGFIRTLNKLGIFLSDKYGNIISDQRKGGFGVSSDYVSLLGVVFSIDIVSKNRTVSYLDLQSGQFSALQVIFDTPGKKASIVTVDATKLMAIFRALGVKIDRQNVGGVITFLSKEFGIGISKDGKVFEGGVQYMRVYHENGSIGTFMVTGQGYNVAWFDDVSLFMAGKSFDLVDIKTLLTSSAYTAMAKEIRINKSLLASTMLNIYGSVMKSQGLLQGASKDILDLLDYDVSKLPPGGIAVIVENGQPRVVLKEN